MLLQPSEERRRSGSHYTPRALTEPIVRTTLEPILARLRGADGRQPQPAQILDLKVCDPAMGSGAFLVEACRQLGDALVDAWRAHGEMPSIPTDEDEVIFARRLVAQRCLYGVDKNPVAVDLAKMSLWLATMARDHALTFVDHALRHGDSLVGLSRKQIEAFHWVGEDRLAVIRSSSVVSVRGSRQPVESFGRNRARADIWLVRFGRGGHRSLRPRGRTRPLVIVTD
jgi:type I restriction-modification system DNA methylase subunit